MNTIIDNTIDNTNLIERINKLRDDYATENKSWGFSTKQYKINCANTVLQTIDIDTLLDSTITILPNSCHLFFNYVVFKSFAVPELYDTIIDCIVKKINTCVERFGKYEMHINLQSFSVSAFNRYKPIIEKYHNEIHTKHIHFHEKMQTMHVYNIPHAIDTIAKLISPFLDPIVQKKIVKYDKPTSEKSINTINEILSYDNKLSPENLPLPMLAPYFSNALHADGNDEAELHIRLYVSHVHTEETPADLILECNDIRGRNRNYWTIMKLMKQWILDEIDTPIIPIVKPKTYIIDDEEIAFLPL
jgi:hypothetical protein